MTVTDVAYSEVKARIWDIVSGLVPPDARVLIATKGDEDLLAGAPSEAWHFPRLSDGQYGGYHPESSVAAIAHLEALRARGAQFLLIPEPSAWWLEHYPGFRRHLESRYRQVVRQGGTCFLFDVDEPATEPWTEGFEQVAEAFRVARGCDPAVLDWNTDLNLAAAFPYRTIARPGATDELPYLDGTIDLVAVRSPDEAVRREAERVAGAVLTFGSVVEGQPPEASHGLELAVDWKIEPGTLPPASVSVAVPCCKGGPELMPGLRGLLEELPASSSELLIVDDALPEEESARLEAVAAADRRVTVLRNSEKLGFLASGNRAASGAAYETLLFVGEGAVPLPGSLRRLLRTLWERPNAGAVGAKLLFEDGRLRDAGGSLFADGSRAPVGYWHSAPDAPLFEVVREVDYCAPGALCTPRSVFLDLGGFDPGADREEGGFGLTIPDYADYCLAVRDRGLRAYYQPLSAVVGLESTVDGPFRAIADAERNATTLRLGERSRRVLHRYRERPWQLDHRSRGAADGRPPAAMSGR